MASPPPRLVITSTSSFYLAVMGSPLQCQNHTHAAYPNMPPAAMCLIAPICISCSPALCACRILRYHDPLARCTLPTHMSCSVPPFTCLSPCIYKCLRMHTYIYIYILHVHLDTSLQSSHYTHSYVPYITPQSCPDLLTIDLATPHSCSLGVCTYNR